VTPEAATSSERTGGVRADTEVGLGPGVTADINVEEGSDPEVSATAGIPNVIGASWNPAEPHGPPCGIYDNFLASNCQGPASICVIDHLNPYFLERSPNAVPAR